MSKTKPYSIRFDTDKLEFAKTKYKIVKEQQLVDYMLEKLFWESKVGRNPIVEIAQQAAESKKQESQQANTEPTPLPPTFDRVEWYASRFNELSTIEEVQALSLEFEADKELTAVPKMRLREHAKNVSKGMYND